MPNNNRKERINEEVLRNLSELLRTVKDPRISSLMISVLRCEVTNDLRWCKVHISVLGDYDEKSLKKALKSASGFLRVKLAQALSLRYTPELLFSIDDSISHGAKISKMINDLNIKSEDDEDNQE